MGAIYDDFTRELAVFRDRYRGRPRDEMLHLWLLALEREQIVAVAYAEERLLARIDELPQEARALAAAALAWAWRDEQMHAIYIRGALLKVGSRWLRARALVQQLAGGVAGWATFGAAACAARPRCASTSASSAAIPAAWSTCRSRTSRAWARAPTSTSSPIGRPTARRPS